MSAAFNVPYGVDVGGCKSKSRTSAAYSFDKEAAACTPMVHLSLIRRVLKWASTWVHHSSGSPGQNSGSISPTALTVGAGRETVDLRMHDSCDGGTMPGLICTPGSGNWIWVLGAVKPASSAPETGVRKVLAVVAIAGVVKPALVVIVDIVSPEIIHDYQK